MSETNPENLFLPAVLLPPACLEILGPVVDEKVISTPFGTVGPIARRTHPKGASVWVLPYSGLPSRLDPRAAVSAAQTLRVSGIVAWDAAISLNPALTIGRPALVVDFVDFTPHSIFSDGADATDVTTAEVSPPPAIICPQRQAAMQQLLPGLPGVVYMGRRGNRRETIAEARIVRQWGIDVIGYNLIPEIILAGQAGLCFTALVSVTRFASGAAPAGPDPKQTFAAGIAEMLPALPAIFDRLAAVQCSCHNNK